ncbi:MAG: thioredoxin domain-containing protein [Candidatus Absconditicoccaceae bacterium]
MKVFKKFELPHIWLVALLALNILLTLFVIVRKDPSRSLEEMKAGGAENFTLVQELYSSDTYKKQQKDSITQFLGSIKGTDGTTQGQQEEPTDIAPSQGPDQAMIDKLNTIKKDGYVSGNPDAQITILEYSDLVCPFCKRQSAQGTLEKVLEKYNGKVNRIFRQSPLVNLHPTAPKAAEGAECAGELGGAEKYYEYLVKAFALTDTTDETIKQVAKDMGLKTAKFDQCLDSGKYTAKVNAQLQEGQGFGVSGTPGNVIVNSTNGQYVLVAGAYPVEKFVEEIDKMLAAK